MGNNNRIRKLGGKFDNTSFKKVLKQLNGRAVLVVVVINRNCEECSKLMKFIGQLEAGFIDKLQQLVLFYGFNETPLEDPNKQPPPRRKDDEQEEGRDKDKKLADTRILDWKEIPEGHGYGIFLNEDDILFYQGEFNHDEFVANIVDSIRRFKSSIKTLAGLGAKNQFLKAKRTGIIIETNGATQHSQIMELEKKVKEFGTKLTTPVYFCKGISQEMILIVSGKAVYRQKGHNITKFLKKIPK